MRQILFMIVAISLMTNCSERESQTLDVEIRKLSEPSQVFVITNEADTIEAKNGTRLIIRRKAFVFNDGVKPKESIQIELKEVFNKADMILNGVGTVSDGRLLESLGMIYINAKSENKELKIKNGSSINASIPNKIKGYAGELFYGVQTDSVFNWNYAGTTKDTTEVIETIMPLANELESVKKTTYRFVNGLREFVSDTLFTRKVQYRGFDEATEYAMEPSMSMRGSSYEFELTNLGWINCDRFIEIKEKVNLEIGLKDFSQPIGWLIFNDINSVMQFYFNEKGEANIKELPNNYNVDVIIVDKIKDKLMWIKRKVKIGTEHKLILKTTTINEDKLKSELNALDR